ncbi:serine hydrolase [Agaribacter flavus]|uniref:Serine hydrolase n=1 Tax=Agaribacter flavus TaxID=1902781 RepID=A0ABV7FNM0_9ALTE
MYLLSLRIVIFGICCSFTSLLYAQTIIDENELEDTVLQALESFNTPGMSIALVYQGKTILSKGYGLSNLEQNTPVTPQTYFRLASTSKAFTAASLAILVDEGKLNWDDLVIDHIPQFRLNDSYATQHFTVKDLLTHNSGLVGGAGDSMIWPEPSGFDRKEVIENLRFLSPEYPFHSRYAYSNVMYIVAGALVERVSNIPFERFVDQRIFKALDMPCYSGSHPQAVAQASAMAYGHNDRKGLYPIPRNAIKEDALMSAAAGGMICNAEGMSKWLTALTTKSRLPFSEAQLEMMWTGHTLLNLSKDDQQWFGSNFHSYGLGWRLSNIGQFKLISHTGTLSGYQAYIALIPELSLGISILNNGSNYGARSAVMNTILSHFVLKNLNSENSTLSANVDWVARFIEILKDREQKWLANNPTPVSKSRVSIPKTSIIGDYQDEWFGGLKIWLNDNKLRIKSMRMKTLIGTLTPFQDSTFKIDWDNENAQADAFIEFELNTAREVTAATLRPFSLKTRKNHAYRDMYFIKTNGGDAK